jgi:D-serine deaminase-like pyridoxal phosphate-dependent protein
MTDKMENSVKYEIENVNLLDTPALVVYPSIVTSNIQQLIDLFDDVQQIRPHVKTHKCPQVVRLLLDSGITKFKCATIAEAEMLGLAGATDVLIAYQPVGPKIERLIRLMITYPNCLFACLVDDKFAMEQISEAATQNNVHINCYIDLNVGMDRTGVRPDDEAKGLFFYSQKLTGIKIVGVHAYDGHLTDRDVNVRLTRAEAGFSKVKKLVNDLSVDGFPLLRIVAGSTPTLSFYAMQEDVECSPGTFVYWDQHYQDSYPDLSFESAALVLTRVVSTPTSNTACLDLGYKAISSEGEINERVSLLGHTEAKMVSHSEEHLLISTGTEQLRISEVVYGLPYHIGRTCNLYETSAIVEDGRINGSWLHTARSRQINI